MISKRFKNIEWKIIIYVILLLIIGLVALYSASISSELQEFKKQIIWIFVGIPILLVTMLIDYKTLARFSIYFYGISIILLIAVLFTSRINGARSWFTIGQVLIQPGEIVKIFVILFLANIISKR